VQMYELAGGGLMDATLIAPRYKRIETPAGDFGKVNKWAAEGWRIVAAVTGRKGECVAVIMERPTC